MLFRILLNLINLPNLRSMEEFYQHQELTGQIIGGAMRVHKVLGNGFQEVMHQRALAVELGKRGLPFAREAEVRFITTGSKLGYDASTSWYKT